MDFTFTGPSGAGKSEILKRILVRDSRFRLAASCTTRELRPGEIDGRDYIRLSRPEFLRKIQEGGFLEHAEVHGELYGTLRTEIVKARRGGLILLMDMDCQGVHLVRKSCPEEIFSFFIYAPSREEIVRRLRARGEKEESIVRRLKTADTEMRHMGLFDELILNKDIDLAVEQVTKILSGVLKGHRRPRMIPNHADLPTIPGFDTTPLPL